MMHRPAPLLLFTYKRLETLRQTVASLQNNFLASETELIIFSDGPKSPADAEIIEEVRKFLATVDGFKKVHIHKSESNRGLATSIISGVTTVFETHDKLIVLEDDLITTPNFLSFMNFCLNEYADSGNVFSVSGYSFNLQPKPGEVADVYFLNRGWSWGWATWKDRWTGVDWEVKDYAAFSTNKKARTAFAKGGSDLNAMLRKQMSGELDSWAIRWFFHQYKVGGLTAYPVFSKVLNNGFDSEATHTTGSSQRYRPSLDMENKTAFRGTPVENNTYYQQLFSDKMGIKSRIISKVRTIFKKIAG